MRIARENHRVSHKGLEYKAGCVAADLGEAIRESGLNLQELMEKGAYRKLGNLFVAYYKAQLSLILLAGRILTIFMHIIIRCWWIFRMRCSWQQ